MEKNTELDVRGDPKLMNVCDLEIPVLSLTLWLGTEITTPRKHFLGRDGVMM